MQKPVARSFSWPTALGLKAGDLVEVRSAEEILATLDGSKALDGMPFMPEMLRHCGRQFRVSRRAEISCDTISTGKGRRVRDAVHLGDLRCDGSAHGGCQALCLMWWKEAWLKRTSAGAGASSKTSPATVEEALHAAASRVDTETGDTVYTCQVTRLLDFTERQDWDEPWHYLREIRCRNVGLFKAVAVILRAALNAVRRKFGRLPVPSVVGKCTDQTPAGNPLGIKAGDWVIVKSKEEIEASINAQKRNRGLAFDVEMLPYCGRRMQALQKVDHIVNEHTGRMLKLPNDCWILAGAWCHGYMSRNRLFCTRAIYSYWREIWLRRDASSPAAGVRDAT
ncbi:MAG: hypothetical protein ACRETU_07995 [Steroidobacterales bacterium]